MTLDFWKTASLKNPSLSSKVTYQEGTIKVAPPLSPKTGLYWLGWGKHDN